MHFLLSTCIKERYFSEVNNNPFLKNSSCHSIRTSYSFSLSSHTRTIFSANKYVCTYIIFKFHFLITVSYRSSLTYLVYFIHMYMMERKGQRLSPYFTYFAIGMGYQIIPFILKVHFVFWYVDFTAAN